MVRVQVRSGPETGKDLLVPLDSGRRIHYGSDQVAYRPNGEAQLMVTGNSWNSFLELLRGKGSGTDVLIEPRLEQGTAGHTRRHVPAKGQGER